MPTDSSETTDGEEFESHAAKQFAAATEELRTMPGAEFEEQFGDLLERLEVFDTEADTLLVQFALDTEGIEKWRYQHLDTSISGSYWDMQKDVQDFDADVGLNIMGANTFSLAFVEDGAPSREGAKKALYAAFRQASKVSSPEDLLAYPGLIMRVDVTDSGFSISYI